MNALKALTFFLLLMSAPLAGHATVTRAEFIECQALLQKDGKKWMKEASKTVIDELQKRGLSLNEKAKHVSTPPG